MVDVEKYGSIEKSFSSSSDADGNQGIQASAWRYSYLDSSIPYTMLSLPPRGQPKDRLYTVGCNTYQSHFPSFNLSYFIIQGKKKFCCNLWSSTTLIPVTEFRRHSRQIMQSPKMFVSPILQFLTSYSILQTGDSAVHRLQEAYCHIEPGIVRKVQVAGAGVFFRIWIFF